MNVFRVKTKEQALEYIKNDKNFQMMFIANDLMDDREVILSAVSKDGACLCYASDRLKADREIVLTAVSNNGPSLALAIEQFRDDKEIALLAVSNQYAMAIEYVSDRLRDDFDIARIVVSNGPCHAVSFISERLKDNKELAIIASKKNPYVIRSLGESARKDIEVACHAIDFDPSFVNYFHKEVRLKLEEPIHSGIASSYEEAARYLLAQREADIYRDLLKYTISSSDGLSERKTKRL